MNNNNTTPETLYRQYKAKRTKLVSSVTAATDTSQPDKEELIDQLYRQYQQTRNPSEVEIDKIMQLIATATGTGSQPVSDHTIGTGTPAITSVGRAPEHNTVVPIDSGAPTHAKNDSGYVWKYVVPAMAATLLVFLVYPLFSNNNGSTKSSPDMAFMTAELASYIEPGSDNLLGFSNTDNDNSTAIRYGILSADLQILSRAETDTDRIQQIVMSYLMTGRSSTEAVTTAAQAVITNTSTDSVSTIATVDGLITELASHTTNTDTFAWYNVGRAVESIILAAQLALATADTTLLRSAVIYGNSLSIPHTDPALQSQVTSLFRENVEEQMAPAGIRQILGKAQDIKSVVQ